MKEIVISMCLAMFTCLPSHAVDGQLILVYRNGATRTNEVLFAPISTIQSPDIAIPFGPEYTDRIADHYLRTGSQISLSLPVVPVSNVDLAGFKSAIEQSEALPDSAINGLVLYFPLLDAYIRTPEVIQRRWASIKAGFPAEVISVVEALADQYHVPLVAQ